MGFKESSLIDQVISNEVLSRHNVYGVTFDGVTSEGKPLYNAIDQKWVPATPTNPGVDTWKDIAPFNVKKCITYSDAIASGWEELDVPLPGISRDTWFSELAWNFNEPWALYPSKFGGNEEEPIGDCFWNTLIDPFSGVAVSGSAWHGTYAGALYWDSGISSSLMDGKYGGRSLEIIL